LILAVGQRGKVARFAQPAAGLPSAQGPVAVVGASGKVGSLVVQRLLEKGRPVVAVVKNESKAREVLGTDAQELTLLTVDLADPKADETLAQGLAGCTAVVMVSGAARITKLSDILWPPMLLGKTAHDKRDPTHPYFVNYEGVSRVLQAMRVLGIKKIVRLTGLSSTMPAFNPVSIIFNMLLSMTSKWHYYGEALLMQEPGLDYTIIRPGGLRDTQRGSTTGVQASATGAVPAPALVGRSDVADLCVESLENPRASRRGLSCRWVGEVAPGRFQGSLDQGSARWDLELAKLQVEPALISTNPMAAADAKARWYGIATSMVTYPLLALFLFTTKATILGLASMLGFR